MSLSEQANNNSLEKELGTVDFPEKKHDLIRVLNKHRKAVALTGEKLERTDVTEHRINLIDKASSRSRYLPTIHPYY